MRIIYCKQCSPKKVVSANDVDKVISHNVYDAKGNVIATHTDFGTLDNEESFTADLIYLYDTYNAEFV